MGKKLEFMRMSEEEDLSDVQDKVCKELTNILVDRSPSHFECSFDDTRLYEFQWKEKWKGYAYFVAFVDANKIDEFMTVNRVYAEWLGFDPLDPDGFEVRTKVYVCSPDSFPIKGISSLLKTEADVVLVSTDEVIDEYLSIF